METVDPCLLYFSLHYCTFFSHCIVLLFLFLQAYQRLQIQQQMMQAQRNVSGPIRQQEQQVSQQMHHYTNKQYDHKGCTCVTQCQQWHRALTQQFIFSTNVLGLTWCCNNNRGNSIMRCYHRSCSNLKISHGNRLLLVRHEPTSLFSFFLKCLIRQLSASCCLLKEGMLLFCPLCPRPFHSS